MERLSGHCDEALTPMGAAPGKASSLRIALLLEETGISSTARLTAAAADALLARGHQVRIVTTGLPMSWRSSNAEWIYLDRFAEYDGSDDVVLVAEGRKLILRSRPQNAFEHIMVDDEFYRERVPPERTPLRVLLPGGAQEESKAIGDGYGAVAHARWFRQQLELVRVSRWAPSREEPLDDVQEFHVALSAFEVARLVHTCDVVLLPSHADEGLVLSGAEALASGIPAVMTATDAHLALSEAKDHALFAPENNAVELGEQLIEMLSDRDIRERLRRRSRDVARQWRTEAVGAKLEAFVLACRAGS